VLVPADFDEAIRALAARGIFPSARWVLFSRNPCGGKACHGHDGRAALPVKG